MAYIDYISTAVELVLPLPASRLRNIAATWHVCTGGRREHRAADTMASCFRLLGLLTITWTLQLASFREFIDEERLLDSAAAVTLVPIPVPTKHADSELKMVGSAHIVKQGVRSSTKV